MREERVRVVVERRWWWRKGGGSSGDFEVKEARWWLGVAGMYGPLAVMFVCVCQCEKLHWIHICASISNASSATTTPSPYMLSIVEKAGFRHSFPTWILPFSFQSPRARAAGSLVLLIKS